VTALEAGRGSWRLTDAEYGGARPAVHREDPEEAAVRIVPVEVGVRVTRHRLFDARAQRAKDRVGWVA